MPELPEVETVKRVIEPQKQYVLPELPKKLVE